METVKEFLDSMKSYLRTRLSNPLYAAYFVSWSYLNFRLLLVIFGDGGWKEKIQYIDTKLFSQNWHWWWFGFAYPMLLAVAYVLIAPFAYRWVTLFIKTTEKKTVEKLMQVAGETPLPLEVAKKLRKKVIDLEASIKAKSAESQAEIDELSAQIQQLRDENHALTDKARKIEVPPIADVFQSKGYKSNMNDSVVVSDATTRFPNSKSDAASTDATSPLSETRPLNFEASEFVGVAAGDVIQLNNGGLSGDEILALYAIRNMSEFDADALTRAGAKRDTFSAQLIYDRLIALKLIQRIPGRSVHQLTSFARQVLDKLIKSAVVETLLKEV